MAGFVVGDQVKATFDAESEPRTFNCVVAFAFVDKAGELRVGDLVPIDVEGRDVDMMRWPLVKIAVVLAHGEFAAGHKDHAPGRFGRRSLPQQCDGDQ